MATRIYLVIDASTTRLVEAGSVAQVRAHLTRDTIIQPAKPQDVAEQMSKGRKVEKAEAE